jgi:Predicted permeases
MTDALLQVFLLVGVGLLVARLGWIDEVSTQSFSNLVLKVFLPALLFRTMATVDFNALSLLPIFNYLSLTMLTYALAFSGRNARRALCPTPANEARPSLWRLPPPLPIPSSSAFQWSSFSMGPKALSFCLPWLPCIPWCF